MKSEMNCSWNQMPLTKVTCQEFGLNICKKLHRNNNIPTKGREIGTHILHQP